MMKRELTLFVLLLSITTQAFASGVVGNRGATVSDPGFYQAFLDQWQLNG